MWDEQIADLEARTQAEENPDDKKDMQESLGEGQKARIILEKLVPRLNDSSMPNFKEFLEVKRIDPNDERVPLLREVWNQAIGLAAESMLMPPCPGWGFTIVALEK